MSTPTNDSPSRYAIEIANASYTWYVTASKRSRRAHRIADVATLLISASIPVAAAVTPKLPQLTAVLGAVLVIIAGVRAIYHWQENYLRFSQVREAIEEQRRMFHVAAPPYDDPATRDAELVKAVTRLEQAEMGQWAQITDTRTVRRTSTPE